MRTPAGYSCRVFLQGLVCPLTFGGDGRRLDPRGAPTAQGRPQPGARGDRLVGVRVATARRAQAAGKERCRSVGGAVGHWVCRSRAAGHAGPSAPDRTPASAAWQACAWMGLSSQGAASPCRGVQKGQPSIIDSQ